MHTDSNLHDVNLEAGKSDGRLISVPISQKVTLTIKEAAQYSNIGICNANVSSYQLCQYPFATSMLRICGIRVLKHWVRGGPLAC